MDHRGRPGREKGCAISRAVRRRPIASAYEFRGPHTLLVVVRAHYIAPMRYLTLCTDYDGTIAHDGKVDAPTIAALEELRASGRKLVLVTGREIEDLQSVFDRLDLFERVVAENGALIYRPATREERVIGDPPPARFVEELRGAACRTCR